MQIYEALKKDHVAVKKLLEDLVNAADAGEETRNSLIEQIRAELIPHSRAEESVLYNSLRELDSGKSLALHGYQEHLEAEMLLRSLQVTGAVKINWVGGAKKLKKALEHHVAEEEGEIFSAAQKLFTSEEAEAMNEAFQNLKAEIKKDDSFVSSTKEMITNIMPSQLRKALLSEKR
jgi:hemerythrin superfamily protein